MDHYPYPSEPLYPPVRVPYLPFTYLHGRNGDASAEFDTFPARNGWKKVDLLDGELDYATTSPQSACAFLQAWLFFGVASTILDLEPQCESRFVFSDEEGPYVSTKCLPDLIKAWTDETLSYTTDEAQTTIRNAMHCLDECSVFCLASAQDLDGFRLEKYYPEVRLSIMALGEQLQVAVRQIEIKLSSRRSRIGSFGHDSFGHDSFLGRTATKISQGKSWRQSILKSTWSDPYMSSLESAPLGFGQLLLDYLSRPEDEQSPAFIGPWQWGTSIVLWNRLIGAGWCRYEAARVNDILSPWALHYASALSRPALYDHSKCEELHCSAHTIDEATYQTQHTTENCNCEFIGLPTEEVRASLLAGEFPVFRIVSQADSFKLTVKKKSAIGTFDLLWALSHVWSHGLGNAKANTLPTCQIKRLFDIAGSIGEKSGGYLWLDTLCVPLDRELRRTAVSQLGHVYSDCFGTLVLDKELLTILVKDKPDEEKILRIVCSSWMQRLWTMQEGAKDEATIAFSDGQYNIKSLLFRHTMQHPLLPIAKGGNASDTIAQMLYCRDTSEAMLHRTKLREKIPDKYGK